MIFSPVLLHANTPLIKRFLPYFIISLNFAFINSLEGLGQSFHTELQKWTAQNYWHPKLNIW